MRLVHKDPKQFEVKLVPETLDDLWHLHNLIDKGDHVTALTFRTRDVKEEKVRSEKISKVPVELTIEAEDIEFAAFADRLRIRGPIVAGSEELGSYHSLNLEADGRVDVRIRKVQGFRPHHYERIREAVEAAKRPLVTIVCLDDEEAVVAVLRQYGIQPVATIKGVSGGKMFRTEHSLEEYFGQLLAAARRVRAPGSPLVVVGPGFTRESFLDFVKQRDAAFLAPFVTEGTGQSGMVGVQEALKRGVVGRVQRDQQVATDTQLVEEIFAEIGKDGPVGYGAREVESLLNQGAVRLLVITDEVLRTPQGASLLTLARRVQAQSHIVAVTHEAGKKLHALGGIAALLRYKPTTPESGP